MIKAFPKIFALGTQYTEGIFDSEVEITEKIDGSQFNFGKIEGSPRDIGKLIAGVMKDITEEEQEEIKKFLWQEFSGDLLRFATKGLPEWYKEKLLEKSIK